MNAQNQLSLVQASNRNTGRQRLKLQLAKPEDSAAFIAGYDASSGRLTARRPDGQLMAVKSLTTAAFPVGRSVEATGAVVDGIPG